MSCVYVQQRTEWKDTSWTWLSGGFKQELLCQIDNGIGQQDLEVVVVDRVVLRPRQTSLGCYGDDTVVGLVHQRAAAAGRNDGADRNADPAAENAPDRHSMGIDVGEHRRCEEHQ